jgi:hypothetical protein
MRRRRLKSLAPFFLPIGLMGAAGNNMVIHRNAAQKQKTPPP